MRIRRGVCLLVSVLLPALTVPTGAGAQAARTAAVADFYALAPYGGLGITPERLAADALSDLLARSSGGRLTVVPRPAVQEAEASLGWRTPDVLRFDRLRALARAAGADTVVAGWITTLVVNDFGALPEPDAYANVNLVLQIYDARAGRIVGQTQASSYVTAGVQRDLLTAQALREADANGLPPLLQVLAAGSP